MVYARGQTVWNIVAVIYRQSIVLGAMFLIAGEFLLACMGATIKWTSSGLPSEMIVFFRNLFGLLALSPLIVKIGVHVLKTDVFVLHLLRGLAGVMAMYCFFFAIAHIPLADAMLLKLTSPIFIPMIAMLWLKERFPVAARWALLIGFVGVWLILKPGGDAFNWVMLVAIAGGVAAAVAKVTIRRLSATEPAVRTVFYFAVIAAGVSALPLVWAWQMPTLSEWLLLLSLGPLATAGQLLMTRGYAAAPASQVGIFTYSSVVFGAGLGWLFWDELWDAVAATGALLVAVAGALALGSDRSRPAQDTDVDLIVDAPLPVAPNARRSD
ncbi:MAG: DMT family transporter [Gammaproteobacteria bacterium]|nr:DMT family transporter [Gammaproteobacteria bacterium]